MGENAPMLVLAAGVILSSMLLRLNGLLFALSPRLPSHSPFISYFTLKYKVCKVFSGLLGTHILYLLILLQNSLHLFVVLASYMDFLPPPRCLARVICSGCGAQQQNRLRCHQHCWRLWHNFDNNNFHF